MKVLDMCTEYGSETAAFRDRGHEIVTLGIEGDVDIKCDVRNYYPSVDDHYDFVICHPPCTEFSIADWRKGACAKRNPDMSIVWACMRIIETLKPQFWMLENPRGCLRQKIGMPQVTIKYGDYGFPSSKPTDLWGVFPWFYSQTPVIQQKNIKYAFANDRKKNRSMIPYGLSLAICISIESCLSHSTIG